MSYLAHVFVCIAVFIDAGAAKLNEQRFNIITSNKESAIVRVGMLITSISDVNFKQSTFKATLSLTIVLEKSKRPVGSSIVRYDQYLYPFSDIIILSKSIRPLDDYRLVTTAIDGTSTSQLRYNTEIFCAFQLNNYPFDIHICEIVVLSVRHPVKQLTLTWIDSEGARINQDVSPPNVHVSMLSSEQCEIDSTYALTEFNAATARFGCVRAKLLMSRPLYIPLVRFFVPSGVAMLIAWIVVYVDRTRIQTRLTLLIFSCFLVLFVIFKTYNDIPPLIFLTAGDIWIIICSLFLFLSFIEVILAHVLMNLSRKHLMLANKDIVIRAESRYRREKHALREACSNNSQPPSANGRILEKKHVELILPSASSTSNSEVIVHNYFRRWSDYYSVMAARLDLGARILLPVVFTVVMLLYFLFYIFL